ncbi:MAG: hypothetical protein K0Q56_2720 [Sporolactobacillus laevolacticus]|jgi:hypothetical protein|nr:hypothetical protein [Sporolactobacillus laevolacticus]
MSKKEGELSPDQNSLPQSDCNDLIAAEDAQPTLTKKETTEPNCNICDAAIIKSKKFAQRFQETTPSLISAFLLIFTLMICITAIVSSLIFNMQNGRSEENNNPLEYVSLNEYNKIKAGMTYTQVEEIIGVPGQLKFRTDSNGSKVEFFEWFGKNTSESKVSIIFENELVTSKTQFGLE